MSLTGSFTQVDALLHRLVVRQIRATPEQLAQIVEHVSTAPFVAALLEVDEPLWGSFWHFDVISPGYTLPAVELALLRATRLDGHWPEDTNVEQFLSDLRQAMMHPQAGVWTLALAGEPCAVFAAPISVDRLMLNVQRQNLVTVVWYCATTGGLHAGYRAAAESVHFDGAIEQRAPEFAQQDQAAVVGESDWVAPVVEQMADEQVPSLAARLDLEILRIRSKSALTAKG